MTEILAPVGNINMLDAALAAGCDAVYLGLQQFGARASAENFTLESVKEAIDRCHIVGVHVHVTMNTILFEHEVEDAYAQAKALYEMGVDALIIQDIGLIHLLHERLPNLEVHASTQMSIMTIEQIEQLKQMGVKRVVLARECSLEQIQACKQAGLEVEVFVHGAMCICFSGQCYFSSVRYGRSGNRGACAQPCRMPYTLLQDGETIPTRGMYILSPKDLSLIDKVDRLDVDSLKIEGRMKSAAYVYEAVRQVRMALTHQKRTEQDRNALKMTFHRGYTWGHALDQRGHDLMNTKSCNHQGIEIGTVIAVQQRRITIRLTQDLYQNDGIRFDEDHGCRVNFLYDAHHALQNHIKAGSIAQVEGPSGVKKGSRVLKTISYRLEQHVTKQIKETVRKVPIALDVICQGVGKPLCAIASDGIHTVTVQSDIGADLAKNRSTDEAIIIKQFSKTKTSWVDFDITCHLAMDIFFSIGTINALRRTLIAALETERTSAEPIVEYDYTFQPVPHPSSSHVYIQTLSQEVAPGTMNITNSYGIAAALLMGYSKVYVSDECTLAQVESIMHAFKRRYGMDAPVVRAVYQKRKLMTMKHCPVNTALKDGKRTHCTLCHDHQYALKGKDGQVVLCKGNANCFMELYDQHPQNNISDIAFLKQSGITNYYIHFLDETPREKEYILGLI